MEVGYDFVREQFNVFGDVLYRYAGRRDSDRQRCDGCASGQLADL
jgi:hypothetical protein